MNSHHHSAGSVLPLSLVFVTLMSFAGVAALRMSQVDLGLSGSVIDRDTAFNAAEMALADAEQRLLNQAFSIDDFSNNCVDGLCFAGTFVPGGNCTLGANSAASVDVNWQNATVIGHLGSVTAEPARYLIEFQCFMPVAGASPEALLAQPAPSALWQPRVRIYSRSTGRSGLAYTLLQTDYLLPAPASAATVDMPAIFATNGDLTTVDGTNIDVFYCEFCTSSDIHFDTNPEHVTFNPNEIAGITYGGSISNEGWTPSGQFVGGKTGEMGYGTYYDAPLHVGTRTGNEFFEQYFGQQDKDAVLAGHVKINPTDFASFDMAGHAVVVVDGDLNLSGPLSIASTNPETIVIVRGNLNLNGAVTMPNLSLMYVEGNYEAHGSEWFNSAMAIEGNTRIRTSLRVMPGLNPLALLAAQAADSGGAVAAAGRRIAWRIADS